MKCLVPQNEGDYVTRYATTGTLLTLTLRHRGAWLLDASHILQLTAQRTWTLYLTAGIMTLASGTPSIIQSKAMWT